MDVVAGVPLHELEQAVYEAAISVHADRRVRSPATDSATLPEVEFVFILDADSKDQPRARAVGRECGRGRGPPRAGPVDLSGTGHRLGPHCEPQSRRRRTAADSQPHPAIGSFCG